MLVLEQVVAAVLRAKRRARSLEGFFMLWLGSFLEHMDFCTSCGSVSDRRPRRLRWCWCWSSDGSGAGARRRVWRLKGIRRFRLGYFLKHIGFCASCGRGIEKDLAMAGEGSEEAEGNGDAVSEGER